jgi:aspartyl-tRNA(Asn)/glutamyl-tRNA(Gln) amidotransferase subunit A
VSDDDLWRLDASTLASEIAARRVTALEVTDAVLERVDRLDPLLAAFVTVVPDEAREQARQVDARLADGEDVGPLAGVPVSVKDLIFTAGIRTASGSHAYRGFVPDEDDVAVERLRAAGAVVIGKTTVPEMGYGGTGQNPLGPATSNPWDLSRTSGGSSAGSAAAVASGLGPLSLGSDGGGSVRGPASFCGLVGLKPTMGVIPLHPGTKDARLPGVSSWESLEHLGPLTRTVADAALALSVLAGPDDRDRLSLPSYGVDWLHETRRGVEGLRVAYSPDLGYARVDPEVRALTEQAARVFERDLGCVVDQADPGWPDPYPAFWGTVLSETDLAGMRRLADELGDRMSPHLVAALRTEWSAEDLTTALMGRKAIYDRAWRFFREYDLLLTPTMPVAAFPHGQLGPTSVDGQDVEASARTWFTCPFNLTGQPAASVPAGWTAGGLPVGLQIAGARFADALVLRACAAYEAAAPWADRWPAVAEG